MATARVRKPIIDIVLGSHDRSISIIQDDNERQICWMGYVETMIGEAVQSANIKPCRLVRNRKRLFEKQGNLIMWVCVHTRRLHTETLPLRSNLGHSAISMNIIPCQYTCTEPNQTTIFSLPILHEDLCRHCRKLWLPCPFPDPLSLRSAQVNITFEAISICLELSASVRRAFLS